MSLPAWVGDRMRPGAVAAAWHDSVEAAFGRMRAAGLDALPVVDDGRVIGLVEGSAAAACRSGGNWLGSVAVASLMRRGPFTCRAGDGVAHALAAMDRLAVGLLAVVDEVGRVVGVVGRDALVEPRRSSQAAGAAAGLGDWWTVPPGSRGGGCGQHPLCDLRNEI